MFPDDFTLDRLYTFWVGIREEAGLPGLRIHDCRHTWASQGVMNGVGLITVGRLLGHRQRETTAIYAYLDDGALRDAAARAAAVIARAMKYRAEPPPVPDDMDPESGAGEPPQRRDIDCLGGDPAEVQTDSTAQDSSKRPKPRDPLWY